MVPLLIGLVIGCGLPAQTAINSWLRHIVDSPLRSSMISFTVGTLFLAAVLLLTMQGLLVPGAIASSQPWWVWTGGVLGVVYLTGNIILFPHLGAAQTVIMPVVGQLIMSMLIDNFGWFALPSHALTVVRVLGGVVVLLGVLLVVFSTPVPPAARQRTASRATQLTQKLPWQVAGICTGMISASQMAINGHLGAVLHSPAKAAFISFVVGTIALWIIVAIYDRGIHLASAFSRDNPWWVWTGGIIGGLFVLGNAFLVPELGTGLTVVIVLFGMIAGGLMIDGLGLLGAKRIAVKPIQLSGILTLVAGVVLIKLF
jgi:transporter family-2 protein